MKRITCGFSTAGLIVTALEGEARGIAKGRLSKGVEVVENMIRKFHVSLEDACETANISVDDYKKYTDKYRNYKS